MKKIKKHAPRRFLAAIIVVMTVSMSFIYISQKSAFTIGEIVYEAAEEAVRRRAAGEDTDDAVHTSASYGYAQLNTEEKICYNQILRAVNEYLPSIELETTDKDVIEKAYLTMLSEHGELFWTSGYTYKSMQRGDNVISMEFCPKFVMKEDKKLTLEKQIDEISNEWVSHLPEGATDYEKAKYVYDTLTKDLSYGENKYDQSVISVFLGNETVCQGVANAAEYLFSKIDIPCIIVTGYAGSDPHAWNMVKLDGEYYLMDATWGANKVALDKKSARRQFTDYSFFNVTSHEMGDCYRHTSDLPFELPECTAIKDNYYIKEGLYFSAYDKESVGNTIGAHYEAGDKVMSIKFGDDAACGSARNIFLEDMAIAEYCPGLKEFSYTENTDNNIITIFFGPPDQAF